MKCDIVYSNIKQALYKHQCFISSVLQTLVIWCIFYHQAKYKDPKRIFLSDVIEEPLLVSLDSSLTLTAYFLTVFMANYEPLNLFQGHFSPISKWFLGLNCLKVNFLVTIAEVSKVFHLSHL